MSDVIDAFLLPMAALSTLYVLVLFCPWAYSFAKERKYPSCISANFVMVAAIALIWRGALA